MKNLIINLLLVMVAPAVMGQNARTEIDRVDPYVFPNNRAKSPGETLYMPDGLSYLTLSADGREITRHETSTGREIEKVFDASHTRNATIKSAQGLEISADGKKLLIYTDSRKIYRRSQEAKYYVFEISRNILTPLSAQYPYQREPIFSPDGRMVAFVADNNIIIKKLDYNNEVAVTKDGVINKIINGATDWTYEEEFSITSTLTWAPDNSALAFVKFDETDVPMYSFPVYEGACDPHEAYALYPGSFSYKYPVAGKPNSKVSVHCYNIETRATKLVEIPAADYIPRIAYAFSPERLMVITLNRNQNDMTVYAANPKSTVARCILNERATSWVRPGSYEDITWLTDGFVIQSARSGYTHLYLYTYAGALQRQLTSGDYNVTAYYGRDPQGNHYFQSTVGGPINRTVSRVDAKGAVTHLSALKGFASATFAPAMNFYTLCYSDITTPPVYTLKSVKGKESRVLENNADMLAKAALLPTKEFITIKSDGYDLNAYIVKPDGFNESTKYPVIMWQYSGPESQEVLNRWAMDWQYAAAREGFVVVCVDGRGTGGRDAKFCDIVYRRLGHYETIDQINAARHIASLPWAGKIGICGWSYGGYETLMAASADNAPYSAAVAIAPVTDWRYYDTVYAERYMLTPQENEDGYESSAPINRVKSMNCPLLIMHGTSDDNVHLSNTLEYAARLVADRKACDMMMFTDKNHSIYGCDARAVVYGKMLQYFNLYLKH